MLTAFFLLSENCEMWSNILCLQLRKKTQHNFIGQLKNLLILPTNGNIKAKLVQRLVCAEPGPAPGWGGNLLSSKVNIRVLRLTLDF